MDEMRAMLDSLMGRDRDRLTSSGEKSSFRDEDVCKHYLVDFCPCELFPNTKSDLGRCTKVHSDGLKELFEKDEDQTYWRAVYEVDFIGYLEKLISQVDQKITKANSRLTQPIPERQLPQDKQEKLDKINAQIADLLKEAETKGEEGDVDGATNASGEVSSLRKEAERLSSTPFDNFVAKERQLRVCEVCGAMQSLGDSMSRFESHIAGKQHLGYEKIRQALERMKGTQEERRAQLSKGLRGQENNCGKDSREGSKGRHQHRSSGGDSGRGTSRGRGESDWYRKYEKIDRGGSGGGGHYSRREKRSASRDYPSKRRGRDRREGSRSMDRENDGDEPTTERRGGEYRDGRKSERRRRASNGRVVDERSGSGGYRRRRRRSDDSGGEGSREVRRRHAAETSRDQSEEGETRRRRRERSRSEEERKKRGRKHAAAVEERRRGSSDEEG
eukprot:GHVS01103184.1.p1 GENE.GHVS01103184.1~~GHVS01103184.1.p1  ORF type:complete len:445 (-),score=95.11 GHVS01103184.1:1154-2488(-)